MFLFKIYVAPGGSDVNEGTINAPWATFAHAVAELTPGDALYVRGGTYSERLVPNGTQSIPGFHPALWPGIIRI